MNNQLVVCDICGHKLGIVDLDTISVPMLPEMFKSINERNGIAPPFQPWMDWVQFVCRQCKNRPFHHSDHIKIMDEHSLTKIIDINKLCGDKKTRDSNQDKINEIFGEEIVEKQTPLSKFQEGLVSMLKLKRVEKEKPGKDKVYKCKCGKTYVHQPSLIRHQRKCNGLKK